MKKLFLIVSIILAANIITSAPPSRRQKSNLPVGKIALPIDNSVDHWCSVTEGNHTFSNEVLL